MQGYYRFPTIRKNTIAFVCEDDLWIVPLQGGVARRLTSNLGEVSHPVFSPDGKHVAFVGREEGHPEVYCMDARGGPARRLTFLGSLFCIALGWTRDSKRILFASNTKQWYPRALYIYSVSRNKDIPHMIPVGPANHISFGQKGVVIGRNTADPARWKRYRGGTVGEIWIDRTGKGNFSKLIKVKGNCTSPMWIGDRIYFIADHEGVGNIYSCTPTGKKLKRHTNHTDFYVRNATTDGENIVYHAGGDIYVFITAENRATQVPIKHHSPRVQTNRKFVEAARYMEDYTLHPKGERVAITSRGKVFSMHNWEGPVSQHGKDVNSRYRLGRWLYDNERMVLVTDEKGEDGLQIHYPDSGKNPQSLPLLDIGRPVELEPSPRQALVALANHRFELILVNLQTKKRVILDSSKHDRITGISWSCDGEWLAYSFPDSERTRCIKLCNVATRKTYRITRPVLQDFLPRFDPQGNYLYFLSNRELDPVYDTAQFELGFPANIKPYLITLRKDIPSPFRYRESAPAGLEMPDFAKELLKPKKKPRKIRIDLDDIEDRIVPFPLPPGKYEQIVGINNKIVFSKFPIEGAIRLWFMMQHGPSNGVLQYYDMKEQKTGVIATGIMNFKISQTNELLMYRSGDRLRIIKPMDKVEQKLKNEPVGPTSGWVDLSRIKVMVEPRAEWQQMYRDAWRLQRDHFWVKDMSGVNWKEVYERYWPLLERIGTRSEFSDLIWEMQGELGTSHAYEFGGDYRQEPQYKQGFLGADFAYDKKHNAYRISNIVKGDPWDENRRSPLLTPGLNAKTGDLLVAIDGRRLSRNIFPQELLVHRAGTDISITIANRMARNKRTVSVKTLKDEAPGRYRDWVEQNREQVHRASRGKIGYVHIPDMGPDGFAEFHRYFLSEIQYPGLLVDVRFNRGGHVSQLLIEKLARRRVGYDISRWSKPPYPYPYESVLGPIVCLTNEYAGSDGDIFSHVFKLYKIGPLIGKRTWGGVIGVGPYYFLSDGGLTTQPEYSFWFMDVGWGVENYGTEPDIEVENRPQDYVQGKDPQLTRGIKECMNLLKKHPPKIPTFDKRPRLSLPKKLK